MQLKTNLTTNMNWNIYRWWIDHSQYGSCWFFGCMCFFCSECKCFYGVGSLFLMNKLNKFVKLLYMQRLCNWYCQNVNQRLRLLTSAKKAIPLSESMFCLYMMSRGSLYFTTVGTFFVLNNVAYLMNTGNLAICIKTSRRRLKEGLHSPHVFL